MRNLWLLEESGISADIIGTENQDSVIAELEDGLMVLSIEGAVSMREYKQIQEYANFARDKKEVKGMAMVLNSPGGLVNGLAETCKEIQNIGKPVFAYTETMAASAAYALASCADNIYASQSADVGSVGARIMHVDYSKMLDDVGIKVTEVGYGKKKTQFSPYHSLSENDKADLSEYVKEAYDGFVNHVKTRRENINKEVFDSGLYSGKKAMKVGLIDGGISTERRFVNFAKKALASKSKSLNNRIMTTQIHTEIDEANKDIAQKEETASGMWAWMKERFGEKPQSDIKSEKDDKERGDDDDEKKKKEEEQSEIAKIKADLAEYKVMLAALQAKVTLIQDMIGDATPVANRGGGVLAGSIEAQLHHHQTIQSGIKNQNERQAYGQEHCVPLMKKLGRIQ